MAFVMRLCVSFNLTWAHTLQMYFNVTHVTKVYHAGFAGVAGCDQIFAFHIKAAALPVAIGRHVLQRQSWLFAKVANLVVFLAAFKFPLSGLETLHHL